MRKYIFAFESFNLQGILDDINEQGGNRYTSNEGIINDHLNVGCILGLVVAPLLTPRIIYSCNEPTFQKTSKSRKCIKIHKNRAPEEGKADQTWFEEQNWGWLFIEFISLFVSSNCGLFINELLYMVHVGKHYIHRLYKQTAIYIYIYIYIYREREV